MMSSTLAILSLALAVAVALPTSPQWDADDLVQENTGVKMDNGGIAKHGLFMDPHASKEDKDFTARLLQAATKGAKTKMESAAEKFAVFAHAGKEQVVDGAVPLSNNPLHELIKEEAGAADEFNKAHKKGPKAVAKLPKNLFTKTAQKWAKTVDKDGKGLDKYIVDHAMDSLKKGDDLLDFGKDNRGRKFVYVDGQETGLKKDSAYQGKDAVHVSQAEWLNDLGHVDETASVKTKPSVASLSKSDVSYVTGDSKDDWHGK